MEKLKDICRSMILDEKFVGCPWTIYDAKRLLKRLQAEGGELAASLSDVTPEQLNIAYHLAIDELDAELSKIILDWLVSNMTGDELVDLWDAYVEQREQYDMQFCLDDYRIRAMEMAWYEFYDDSEEYYESEEECYASHGINSNDKYYWDAGFGFKSGNIETAADFPFDLKDLADYISSQHESFGNSKLRNVISDNARY